MGFECARQGACTVSQPFFAERSRPAQESSRVLGSPGEHWRGGQIDCLIRPDVRLYVGQSGSALVNEQHRVLGINSPALARNAIITVPTQTIDRVVNAILERGHVPRPFLGVSRVQGRPHSRDSARSIRGREPTRFSWFCTSNLMLRQLQEVLLQEIWFCH